MIDDYVSFKFGSQRNDEIYVNSWILSSVPFAFFDKIHVFTVMCGGDAGAEFVWASLKHLVLSHNALECLDESLELAPWLHTLDLSHNAIASAKEISRLSNLKYVNLGYNKLEQVPTFSKTASHSLQVLVLKNNYIDDLNGER